MRKYHPILVVLHWLLVLMIIGGLIMGGNVLAKTPNTDPSKIMALRAHVGMGMLILLLMILRFGVRMITQKPPHADIGNALLNRAGVWAHWGLYLVVFGVCLSGLAVANMAGLAPIVFGGSGDPLPADFSHIPPRAAHGLLTSLLGLIILAHVLAALYHQFIRQDGLFGRMWFGARGGL